MQVLVCKECLNAFRQEGDPLEPCSNCGGKGYVSRAVIRRFIGTMIDYPNVYMGGASRNSLQKSDKVLEYLEQLGFEFPSDNGDAAS